MGEPKPRLSEFFRSGALSRVFTGREQLVLVGTAAAICIGGTTFYISSPRPESAPVNKNEIQIRESPRPSDREPASLTTIPQTAPHPEPVAAPAATIHVSVSGAVAAPGLYEFTERQLVSDALKAAGGALPNADVSDVNLAAPLVGGTTLTIPVSGVAALEDGKRMVLRSGQSAADLNPAHYTISGQRNQPRSLATSSEVVINAATGAAPSGASDGLLDLNSATTDELEKLPGVGPKTAHAIVEYRKAQPFQSIDDLNNVPGIGDKKLEDMRPHVRVGAS